MEKLQNIIQNPYQRSAMESSWTHRILGEKYDDSWQFSNIFTMNDVNRLTTKAKGPNHRMVLENELWIPIHFFDLGDIPDNKGRPSYDNKRFQPIPTTRMYYLAQGKKQHSPPGRRDRTTPQYNEKATKGQ